MVVCHNNQINYIHYDNIAVLNICQRMVCSLLIDMLSLDACPISLEAKSEVRYRFFFYILI